MPLSLRWESTEPSVLWGCCHSLAIPMAILMFLRRYSSLLLKMTRSASPFLGVFVAKARVQEWWAHELSQQCPPVEGFDLWTTGKAPASPSTRINSLLFSHISNWLVFGWHMELLFLSVFTNVQNFLLIWSLGHCLKSLITLDGLLGEECLAIEVPLCKTPSEQCLL